MISRFARLALSALLLAAPTVSPAQNARPAALKLNPQAPSQLQREMKWWLWFSNLQKPPFKARSNGQPWAPQAHVWVTRSLEAFSTGAAPDESLQLLAEAAVPLAAGCRDPLFRYLHFELTHLSGISAVSQVAGLAQLWAELLDDSRNDTPLPPSLHFQCGVVYRERAAAVGEDAFNCFSRDLAQALRRSLEAGDYREEDLPLFAMQTCQLSYSRWLDEEALEVLLREPALPAPLPQWLRELLTGVTEIRSAWQARGGGFAASVTTEGWQGFKIHLTKARESLLKAWELRPDCPEPAACMLAVVKGGHGPPGDPPLLWLERALTACVDHPGSLDQYLSILEPKWGGSRAEMIRFAVACAATGRYDTGLGEAVFTTFDLIDAEAAPSEAGSIYEVPEVGRLILKVAKARTTAPTLARRRNNCLSDYAVLARLCNSPDEVTAALTALQGPLSPRAHLRIAHLGLDEHRLRLEAAALSSPAGPGLKALRKLRREGRPGETLPEYAALLSKVPASAREARAWLQYCHEEAAFEAKLRTPEWATVPARKDLLPWMPRAGDWRPGTGTLAEVRGTGGPARLVLASELPEGYEFELILSREGPSDFAPLGIAVKYGYAGHYCDRWEGLFFQQEAPGPVPVVGYARNDRMTMHRTPLAGALPATFTLLGKNWRRTLTCTLDGKRLDLPGLIPGPHPPFNRFAICAASLAPGETLRIVSLKFRQPVP